jgi:DNA-binding transcriptional regulator YhcF (GntR family)
VKSLADALGRWDRARQSAAADKPAPSSPARYFEKGGFEAYKEHWLRLMLADRELLQSAKLTLVAVSLYLNRGTRSAWPGMRLLAENIGLSKSTVERAVRQAERRGYLETRGRRGSNVYAPAFPRVPPRRDKVSRSDETTVSHLDGTEPLKEPLKEPLRGKWEFEKAVAPAARHTNADPGEWIDWPPSLGPMVGAS